MRGGNRKQYIVDWVIAGHMSQPDPAVDFVQGDPFLLVLFFMA